MSTINLDFVLKLPVEQRVQIVEEIWDSIADEARDIALQPWQAAELDRRLADDQADPASGLSWAQVKQQVMGTE